MKLLSMIVIAAIFFAGCGTKRQYFKPESTQGKVLYSGTTPSKIKNVALYGASLENGQVISHDGIEKNIVLEKNDYFLGKTDDKLAIVTKEGAIKIKLLDGTTFFEKTFPLMVASVSLEKDSMAVVTADNTLYLLHMSNGRVIYSEKLDDVSALDSRIAAPYFLGSLVIFPTLDGKLTIVDRNSGTLVRNVVVSAQRHFNNIISLDVVGGNMIATTSTRAISIDSDGINFIDRDIDDIVVLKDRVFIFTKDGTVMLTDLNLKVIKEKKFPFAIFSGVLVDEHLNIIEKKGHLIKTNLNLEDIEVYEFPTQIERSFFIGDYKVYYENNFIDLKTAIKN